MALPTWLADDMNCGQNNPLSGFTKQFSQDRSLHQDRHIPLGEGSSKRTFRSNTIKEIKDNKVDPYNPYNFDRINNELEVIKHDIRSDNWAEDFIKKSNSSQRIIPNQDNWVSDYAQFNNINSLNLNRDEVAAFEDSFLVANKVEIDWEAEFNAYEKLGNFEFNEQNVQENSWTTEFQQHEQQQKNDLEINGDSKTQLAETAGQLIESVVSETNPKFKNSTFMNFMKKLRDHEICIEGNKVVEQKEPVSKVDDWVNEFKDKSQEFIADYNNDKSSTLYNIHNFETTSNMIDFASEFKNFNELSTRKDLDGWTNHLDENINNNIDSLLQEYDYDWNKYHPSSTGYKHV
ncbi:9116_t:CDS:2 [Diversispora eburnea]|uniref:9116_t:CDS:1 n=1 Tax=Diversispora eburnea TaxID=1213867 RepID=A0A9N8YW57_9GLOM|nr:9116_t:CDS:2 [Diversispora eburnea]